MNGEGSLCQRKSDGRWFGSIVEPDEEGKLKRRTVSAKTKDAACLKLRRLMEEQERLEAEGLPPMDTTVRSVNSSIAGTRSSSPPAARRRRATTAT